MKKMLLLVTLICFGSAMAGTGWTASTTIVGTNFQPNNPADLNNDAVMDMFSITTTGLTASTNPATCTNGGYSSDKNGFLMHVDTQKQMNMYAMIVAAQLHGKKVRFWVSNVCSAWGASNIDGVMIDTPIQ